MFVHNAPSTIVILEISMEVVITIYFPFFFTDLNIISVFWQYFCYSYNVIFLFFN